MNDLEQDISLPPNAIFRVEQTKLTDLTSEEEYQAALSVLPGSIHKIAECYLNELDEIKMDIGKPVQFKLHGLHIQHDVVITQGDLDRIEGKVKSFKSNGRKGLDGTTHRISGGVNDFGRLDKVTFRFGRLLRGVAEPFRDVIESSKGIGFCGKPASGKTTLLRDAILIDSERHGFGINVVDTSNEILGEGDQPHWAFLKIRQDKVGEPEHLMRVLKQAIRNHGTIKIWADEVGYQPGDVELILQAERFGPHISSSVHGTDLASVIDNPVLMPMFGLHKREGKREIVGKPAFESFIEVRRKDYFVLHRNLSENIQCILNHEDPKIEHIFTKPIWNL